MPQSIDINHTELFSDRVVDLVKAGVITNKRKKIYPGIGGQMDFIRGAVNLHGLSLRQRAERLISIAHPDFRSELRTQLMAVRHYSIGAVTMTMEQPNLLKILSAARFAEGLPNKHLQCLCRAARLLRVPANQKLFQEGSVEDEIFVISSGRVRLSMNVPGRGEVPFLTTGPGDLVGWSGVISDGRMTATAVTTDDTTLIALSGKRLRDLCECESDLGYELMKRIAHVLSQRLLSTRLQLLDLFSHAGTAS